MDEIIERIKKLTPEQVRLVARGLLAILAEQEAGEAPDHVDSEGDVDSG